MCKHEFIGNAGGVKCSLCGVELSTKEYRDFLKGEAKPEEPKRIDVVKEEVLDEVPKQETPKAEPKPAPKKPQTKSKSQGKK